jgi:hypothetical protein
MKNIWTWIKNNPIRFMFLIPILLVAVISISHVVSWYDLANPLSWAVYLSIAIEVGAMVALVAATNRIKGGVWFMFGMVTFIQMVGNIFFSFKEVDTNGDLFKSWIELTAPVWEVLGSDPADLTAMKRWLAFLEGGLLPIISLTSLHFFVKFDDNKPKVETIDEPKIDGPSDDEDEDGGLISDSVMNPTYEISKEIYESKEKQEVVSKKTEVIELLNEELPIETEIYLTKTTTLPIVETFASEERYLDLQENQRRMNEPVNDVVNEPVNEPVNDVVNEPVNDVVNDSEGVNEPVNDVVNDSEGVNEGVNEGVTSKTEEPIIETTETINDDIKDILEEIGDEVYTTTTTTLYDEYVKRLSYVKQS